MNSISLSFVSLFRRMELLEKSRPTYNSLAGVPVRISKYEARSYLPKKQWDPFLTDPISHDYLVDPVVFRDNIYDRATLTSWLRRSNLDPMTQSPIESQDLKLVPFLALKYLLHCLEDTDKDYLIYHSVPSEPYFACYLMSQFPIKSTLSYGTFAAPNINRSILKLSAKAYMERVLKSGLGREGKPIMETRKYSSFAFIDFTHLPPDGVLPVNSVFKNCVVPDWVLEKFGGIIETNLRHLSPYELLLSDVVSGAVVRHEIFLTPDGYTVSRASQALPSTNSSIGDTLLGRLDRVKPHTSIPICRLLERIVEAIGDVCFIYRTVPMVYCDIYFVSEKTPTPGIAIRSPAEHTHQRMKEIQALFTADPSYAIALAKLSALATVENVKMGCGRGMQCPLTTLRQDLNVPFLIDQSGNTYGLDLSFLDLSWKIFSDCEFKDYCFVGANLRRTTFRKCRFFYPSFVGADMRDITFDACDFNYCPEFLGITTNGNERFSSCTGDSDSAINLRKAFNL